MKKRLILALFILLLGSYFANKRYWALESEATVPKAIEMRNYVQNFCKSNGKLPSEQELKTRFPQYTESNQWFYRPDDKKPNLVRIQYPMASEIDSAPGEPKYSEFGGSVYAYIMTLECPSTRAP